MQTDYTSTHGGPKWRPTGIDPQSLGVRREDDPSGYLRAYRAAYNRAHKKPPAVFLTPEQKHQKYLRRLEGARQLRADSKRRAEESLTDEQRAEKVRAGEAKKAMFADRRRRRSRAKQAADRRENPEKYVETRINKAKWAKWSEFKWFYEESRRLTKVTGRKWNVEHIYPVVSDWVCGLHTPCNLRVATMRENARKGNRPFGPLMDELWEPDHYSVYWPGESKALGQKRSESERELKARHQRHTERQPLITRKRIKMTPYQTIDEAFHPADPVHEGNLARAARAASLALALPVLTVRSDKWGQAPAFHPLALRGLK